MFIKKSLATYLLLFTYIFIYGQIHTGLDVSFQSAVLSSIDNSSTFYKWNINNPGIGISYYAKTNIAEFDKFANIAVGASAGFAYNRIGKVNFHYPENKEELNKKFSSNLGLIYFDNRFFIDIELLRFLVLEAGSQNRLLMYRQTIPEFRKYLENKNEIEYKIPKFYTDFYASIAIKIKGFVLNYKIFNINKNIYVDDFSKPNFSKEKPTIYNLSLIHIFSLSIPIKSYKNNIKPCIKL